MDDCTVFADWLLEGASHVEPADLERVSGWLRPNFQNYSTPEAFHVNQNGRALKELAMLLRERTMTPQLTRPPRGATRRILLISRYAPSTSHAGGLRVLDLYGELRQMRPDLEMHLYTPSEPKIDGDTSLLKDIFDKVMWTTAERFSFGDFRMQAGFESAYDLIDAQFHDAGKLLPTFKGIGARRLFTPMECMARTTYERMQIEFGSSGALSLSQVFHTLYASLDEIRIVRTADETICVSDADAHFLQKCVGRSPVDYIPTGLSKAEFGDYLKDGYRPSKPSERRPRLVFAAYYGSETNVVGLKWYLDEVHPRVAAAVPDYRVMVVGRGDLDWLINENRENVTVVGEVPTLGPILEQSRGGLVLALHGSGFRGKINQYAVCGLPSISTSLGLTGLCYQHGHDIICADSAGEFAVECIRILCDNGYADRIAASARATALKNYSWNSFSERIRDIYAI